MVVPQMHSSTPGKIEYHGTIHYAFTGVAKHASTVLTMMYENQA